MHVYILRAFLQFDRACRICHLNLDPPFFFFPGRYSKDDPFIALAIDIRNH